MKATRAERIDLGWFRRHVAQDVLPRWLRASPTPEGLFLCHLDRTWKHSGPALGTVVSQSRLLHNMACGYRLTGDNAYLEALEGGLDFLLTHFRDKTHGGWHFACERSGRATDLAKDLYGHAFALFGLSHAFGVTSRDDAREAALHTWQVVVDRFREPSGGFICLLSQDFSAAEPERSQNPVMHLFEALMAAAEHGVGECLLCEAEHIAGFVCGGLLDARGRLPELYDAQWQPLPESEGGRIDVGHQFEWAYLLSHAVEQGVDSAYLPRAEGLLQAGIELGFDPDGGGVRSPVFPDGRACGAEKGWWQQCEALRALVHYIWLRGRMGLVDTLVAQLNFVKRACIDPDLGGWYARPASGDGARDTAKGSVWKVDYHVVAMGMEAARWDGKGVLGSRY
jgi:mannose/cellobiose epimerase-like protein (N-acyl-D-glucosamine 2-epimerase family)